MTTLYSSPGTYQKWRLMDEVESRLKARGCPKINVQIRAGNADAQAFYKKPGFRADDVVTLGKRLEED